MSHKDEAEKPEPREYLTIVIENYVESLTGELDPIDLADAIIDAGFISLHHSIAGQIAQWLAAEADDTIRSGDIAECAAPVDGEFGRSIAVDARDSLHEEPAEWLRKKAAALKIGGEQ